MLGTHLLPHIDVATTAPPAGESPALPTAATPSAGPERTDRAIGHLRAELLAKTQLEAALLDAPADTALRRAYFDLLTRFAARRTGLSHALLPELGHPLYFRCGSSDIANLIQIFRDGAQDFPLGASPARILDLGAYAGYAAVFLARRFPQARLLCVEPSPDSFRLLVLNTMPYRQITRLRRAVWHHQARLGVAARYDGDWGTQLRPGLPATQGDIAAEDVPGLLAHAGWDQVELVKCDIEGAEAAVFADPHAPWLHRLDALAIETHDSIEPGSAAIVAACFSAGRFTRTQHGETTIYERRAPFRALSSAPPRRLRLIHAEPGLFPLALQGVAAADWGFFTFDGTSCQLHPNAPGAAPARVVFPRTLDGQTRFVAELRHAGQEAGDIRFGVRVEDEHGAVVGRTEQTLAAGGTARVELKLPDPPAGAPPWQGLHGRHRIVLETRMAEGAPHNHRAWAHWIDPTLS